MATIGLALLALVLGGCAAASQPPPTAIPTSTSQPPPPTPLSPPPTPPPTRSPTALPTATPRPPTRTPIPPTPTLVPVLPMRISAQLDPPTPHAGEEFVLALSIVDDGSRPARGVYIATSGPWDRWTVLSVEPSGTVAQDAAGWHIVSPLQIPPGETRTLLVHIRADEPAQEQLTFAVREAQPDELAQWQAVGSG